MAPGEFAVRGSLIDLYPDGQRHALSHRPVRRRGREHSRVRSGNAALRRARSQALRLLPAREFPLTAEGIQTFKRRFRNRFPGDLTRMSHLSRHRRRRAAAGHRVLPAAVLRRAPRRCSTTCRRTRSSPSRRDVRGAGRAGVRRDRRAATSSAATTPSVRSSRRAKCSCRSTELAAAARHVPPHRAVARRARSADADAALSELRARAAAAVCASIRAAKSRRASSRASCATSRAAC